MILKYKKFILLFLLVFSLSLYFVLINLPNSCKIDLNDFLNSKYISKNCKFEAKMKIIRKIKSHPKFYQFIKETIYLVTYKTSLLIDTPEKLSMFNNNDLEYVNNSIDKDKLNKIDGILKDKNFYVSDKLKTILNYEEIHEWNRSHGGNLNLKFHNNNKINSENIKNLRLLWKFQSIDKDEIDIKWTHNVQVNPIVIDKTLISIFPDNKVRAFNPLDGNLLWDFTYKNLLPSRRGILGVKEKNKYFVYVAFENFLFKINVRSGIVDKQFGNQGSIKINSKIAPAVNKKDLIVVNLNNVQIFDTKTGVLKDEISLHPKNRSFNSGNVWGGFALDKKNQMIFVTTGNPSPTTYGVKRRGKNKNANSLIAISLVSKNILWSFQEVAHDLWNLDISSPPILHDFKYKENLIETVIVPTKTGNTLFLERNTGKPLFDINYKTAPSSNVKGEKTSKKQIFIDKPERFSKIEFEKSDFNQLDESKVKEIESLIENTTYGWFEPPSFDNDLIMYGIHGGAQWHGAALDPINQNLFIPVNNLPWRINLYMSSIGNDEKTLKKFQNIKNTYLNKCSSCHGVNRNGYIKKEVETRIDYVPSLVGNLFKSKNYLERFLDDIYINKLHNKKIITKKELLELNEFFLWWDELLYKEDKIIVHGDYRTISRFLTDDGLPASNPPWGYIAKLNLESGKIEFKQPIGYLKINNENKLFGTKIFGGVSVTSGGLLFATGTEDGKAYGLDTETGKIIWEFDMEAAGSAPPTIYTVDGKQLVTFIATGGSYYTYKKKGSTIYTFSLDD